MEKTHARAGAEEADSDNAVPSRSPAEIAREREESRLYDGKAMEADSTTIMNHNITGNGSGESGSQGNTLGREDQNPITDGKGQAALPDGSRSNSSSAGYQDER